MNPIVKKDILAVLAKVIMSLKENDFTTLGELSNHVIHDASIFQDDDSVSFAILVYALSKTIQRCIECGHPVAKFQSILQDACAALERDDDNRYREKVRTIFTTIQSADAKLRLYIEEVINKAKIKKGSKLHEHGISVARTAEILGIGQWELMSYVGKTWLGDVGTDDVKKRVEFARKLFVI